MVVDAHPFGAGLKRDRSSHRLQQLRMPQEVGAFSSRQHQDLLSQQWLPNDSPTSYIQPGYGMETMHAQAHISPHHYRMSDAGMMQGDLQELGMASGLPMVEGIQFDDFPSHPRPQPIRTMSTPHPMMLDHNMHGGHGLGLVQQPFYAS